MYKPSKIKKPIVGVTLTHIQILKEDYEEGMFNSLGVRSVHEFSTDDPWWDRVKEGEDDENHN